MCNTDPSQGLPHEWGAYGCRLPLEPEEIQREELEAFRKMSAAERGRLLAMACRAAARLDRSRREAGLPSPVAEAWPECTWEFLRKCARRHANP